MSVPSNRSQNGGRDAKGRFVKGGPGGPGRRATPDEVRAFFEENTLAAARKVVRAMERGETTELQLKAAFHVLDRALGRPQQAVDVALRRGADPGAPGGNPDLARQRLEQLIAAQAAGGALSDGSATVPQTVALGEAGPGKPSIGVAIDIEPAPADADRGQGVAIPPTDEVAR